MKSVPAAITLAALAFLSSAFAQDDFLPTGPATDGSTDENQRLRAVPDTPGAFELAWWARSGRTYVPQRSTDLVTWETFPVIETGQDRAISYGFASDAPRIFVRLRHLEGTFTNPYILDFDLDGLTNQQEFDLRSDPFDSDTDDDLIPDKWESEHGLNLKKASVAFDATEDSDLDGMADAWELQHFGSLAQGYFDDYNRDGVCNGESHWAGSDPALNADALDTVPPCWADSAALDISGESATGITLQWPAATDDRPGTLRYLVYRNNQSIGEPLTSLGVTIPRAELQGVQRWQVWAMDQAGVISSRCLIIELDLGPTSFAPFSTRSRRRAGSIAIWGWPEFRPAPNTSAKWYSTSTTSNHETYSREGVWNWGRSQRTDLETGDSNDVFTMAPNKAVTMTRSGVWDETHTESHTYPEGSGTPSRELRSEIQEVWSNDQGYFYEKTTYDSSRGPDPVVETYQDEVSSGGRPIAVWGDGTYPQPTECLKEEHTNYATPTPWPEEGHTEWRRYRSTLITLSDQVTPARMMDELQKTLPPLSTRPWTSDLPSSSYLLSDPYAHLSEAEYKVRLETTQAGRSYRVRWLEIFTPYLASGTSLVPQVLAEREWQGIGTGDSVESDAYPLSPPAEPGEVNLMSANLALDVPAALPVNDDFDERLADETGAWLDDASTPSPFRSDHKVTLDDLAEISIGGDILNGTAISSLRLSVPVGRERIRLHALDADFDNLSEASWLELADGAELLGAIIRRVSSTGAALDNWEIYAEGLAPGQVVLRLEANIHGHTLSEEKTLYVTRTELVERDPETGETHAVGGLLEGVSPRPAVELRVDSAIIGADEDELLLQVSGTVFDPLSESLAEALARTRALVFEANGRTVSGIANLPDLPTTGSLHRPWQSARFEIEFTRSFRVPVGGPAVVALRAVTTANPAGERGWDEAAVILARIPDGDEPVAVAQAPLRVAAIHHGEGPGGGGAGPAVLRIDGLGEAPADLAVSLKVNGAEQLLAPLTFSPRYFYVVGPSLLGQPMRYLVTLDDSVDLPPGQALRAVRSGKSTFALRVGDRIVSEAEVQAIPLGANSQGAPCLPKPARALADIEEFYKLLYKRPTPGDGGVQLGMVLRQAFEHCGGLVQIGEGDEVEGDTDPSGRLVITIGQEIDPFSAAMGVFEQLVSLSLNPTLQGQIIDDGYGGDLFANGRLSAVRAQAHELGAVVLELYKAAVSIANEGADWAMTIDAVSQGEWSAAIGFLPFVPASGRFLIKKKGTEEVLAEFSGYTVAVMEGAMRAMKLDKIRGRLNVVHGLRDMRNAGFADQKLIDAMVDSGHLTITNSSGYKQLKRVLGPPPSFFGIGYEAHHWIPLEEEIQKNALRRCIDPNEHGIWLPKAIHQQIHNVAMPSFIYRGKTFPASNYNGFWRLFFDEDHFKTATDQQILDFVHFLQTSVYKITP